MMNNNMNSCIIIPCDCDYCSGNRNQNDLFSSNELRNDKKKCTKKFKLYNSETNKPILVNGKEVELPNCINKTKRQLRGVWITTVRNTDFPSVKVYEDNQFNVGTFKQEFLTILNKCKEFNLNAIFVQIRPEADAFYPSKINPYSEYLTGVQGKSPAVEGFDPLAWLIEQTHLYGIEFHAWFNPFRVTPSARKGKDAKELLERLANNNYAKLHPEQTYFFNGQLFLNPGLEEVRNHVVQSIMEVVQNYNIDAVHLDDYFYPYTYEKNIDEKKVFVTFNDESPDKETYLKQTNGNITIEQWREENINKLIKKIGDEVHAYDKKNKKSIAFGISPFGVWASADETNGVGSNTSSNQLSSLSEYVNSKLWVDNEWIDYILPQNYWSFTDPLSSFGEVAYWWNETVENVRTQLYMGLGMYLYDEDQNNTAWQNPNEIINQILYLSTLEFVKGYVFFTYKSLLKASDPSTKAIDVQNKAIDLLQNDIMFKPTIIPARNWLQYSDVKPIKRLKVYRCEDDNVLVFEDTPNNSCQYYAIYRAIGFTNLLNLKQDKNIIGVIGKNSGEKYQYFTDDKIEPNQIYSYGITTLSQAQVESSIKDIVFNPKE